MGSLARAMRRQRKKKSEYPREETWELLKPLPNRTPKRQPDPEKDGLPAEEFKHCDWQPWDGEYDKRCYLVKNKHGRVFGCWPNAGKMMCVIAWNIKFSPEDEVMIYPSSYEEFRIRFKENA